MWLGSWSRSVMTSPLHGEDPGFKSLWAHSLQCLEPLKPKARNTEQSKMGQSDELLKDKNVIRWNENLARGSKITEAWA